MQNTQSPTTTPALRRKTGPGSAFALFLVLLAAGSTNLQANGSIDTCVDPPADMVAWWPGDANAEDLQGDHDGALVGDAHANAPGKVSSAFEFNGINARVHVKDAVALNPTQEITVDAWVRTANVADFQGLISKFDHSNGSSTDDSYQLSIETGGTVRWQIVTSDNSSGYIVDSPGLVADGTWHHVAGTYDGMKARLYVDGVEVAMVDATGTIVDSSTPLYLGASRQNNADAGFLLGSLDEVEIFQRALSATEIHTLFEADSFGKCKCTPPPPDMISWWQGEGNGDDIIGHNTVSDPGTGFGYGSGKVGQAFSFDGMQYATAGTPASLVITGSQVSLDGWIKPTPMNPTGLYMGRSVSGGNDYAILYVNGCCSAVVKTTANGEVFVPSMFTPPTDEWTHVAMTYDGDQHPSLRQRPGSGVAAQTGTISDSGAPFNIGGRGDGLEFTGLIDEVEVFARALAESEIAAIYRAGSAGKCVPCETYTGVFEQGQLAPAAAAQGWVEFRNSLQPLKYVSVNIRGSFEPVGRTLNDPVIVPQIAEALRDGFAGSWDADGFTWNVGVNCGGDEYANSVELNSNVLDDIGTCACPQSPSYIVRPNIGNSNWGGVNSTTCSAPSQTITVSFCGPPPEVPRRFANISARAQVGTGEDVAIGGVIIRHEDGTVRTSPVPDKKLLIRGLGPSTGLGGALSDPYLILFDSNGMAVGFNNDWGNAANASEISATGLAPLDPQEAAILIVAPGDMSYTAILGGVGDTTGLGLLEIYDLEVGASSYLANMSTRARVGTDDDVLIGGFIMRGDITREVVLRAIGPSLPGVADPLEDPVLELHDANGALVDMNDDWIDSPQAAHITAHGLAPTDDFESAIVFTPASDNYTAIVRGRNGGTGVALVEAYLVVPLPSICPP